MAVQDYDPYAIRNYEFTVRKTNSFFSFPTVIISLLIIALSVLVNLNTVKHLWLPFEKLDIQSATSLELSDALTTTIVCFKPSSSTNKNRISVFSVDYVPLLFPFIAEEEVAVKYPRLKEQIGSGFTCLDLQGFSFASGDDKLFIEVQDPSATMYVKGTSLEEVTNARQDTAMIVSSTNTNNLAKGVPLKFIKVTKQDKLQLNHEPQIINTANTYTFVASDSQHTFTGNHTYLLLSVFYPTTSILDQQRSNLQTVTIQRKDLGEILGAVLSWASVLVIIIGFIAAPLMDHTLNLLTAQSLFHLEPKMKNPSLLKYLIATLKSGWFQKQDRYVKMCEQVQNFKDVGTIVKLQMLFSRLVPKTRKKVIKELMASEHSFNQVAKSQVGVALFTDKNSCRPLSIEISEDEKDQNCLVSLRKKLLHLFDAGSDTVSVTYKKRGIGSKKSLCITAIAIIGLLAFLVFFGILKSDTIVSRFESAQPDQSYTIPPFQVLFATATNNPPVLTMRDGNFKAVETLTLASGTLCSQHLSATQIAYLATNSANHVFCFDSPLTLSLSSSVESSRYLHLSTTAANLTVPVYIIDNQPVESSYYKPYKKIQFIPAELTTQPFYYELPIQVVDIQANTNQQLYQVRSFLKKGNTFAEIVGTLIKLSQNKITIEENTTDFFSAIQNIWTFTVICFTVIVMKLTKYVNLKEKQESQTAEKAEFRDSICIFLAKMDGLLHGRHRAELEELKHYTKEPLQDK